MDGIVQYPECISQLVTELILKNGCKVQGQFFGQTRRAVIALEYLDEAYQVFKSSCKTRKVNLVSYFCWNCLSIFSIPLCVFKGCCKVSQGTMFESQQGQAGLKSF